MDTKYEFVKDVGEGTFGCVCQAIDKETREIVAIKTMKREYHSLEEGLNLPEVKSLRMMNHANIIRLKEVVRENCTLYIVFEYMDSNLHQFMRNNESRLSEEQVKKWCFSVIQGLAHMHQRGYYHCDLKPENLLVSNDVIKIGDLGLVQEINSLPPYADYIGTRWYRAPEMLLRATPYTSAVDMWAMGAIMAEMFTLSPVFPGSDEDDQLDRICSVIGTPTESTWSHGLDLAREINFDFPMLSGTSFSKLIPSASEDAINLIEQLCSWDPSKRPTAIEALRHPFFRNCLKVPPGFPMRMAAAQKNCLKVPPGFPIRMAAAQKGGEDKLIMDANAETVEKLGKLKVNDRWHAAAYRPPLKMAAEQKDANTETAEKLGKMKLKVPPGFPIRVGAAQKDATETAEKMKVKDRWHAAAYGPVAALMKAGGLFTSLNEHVWQEISRMMQGF